MPSALFLRAATSDDAEIIASHQADATREARNYRGSLQPQSVSPTALSYVAGYGQTIMGSLIVSLESTTAHINHVFVTPDAREVGLADSLVQFLLNELRERNITYVSAQALPGDRSMKNLFERHGLVAQTIIVGKSL